MSMTIDVKVPKMGDSVSQATVTTLFKKEGEFIRQDEEIIELETDKTNQIIYSPASGIIHYKVSEGQTVLINEQLAVIEPKEEVKEPPIEKKADLVKLVKVNNNIPLEKGVAPINEAKPQENSKILPFKDSSEEKDNLILDSNKVLVKNLNETRQKLSTIRKIIAKRVLEAQKNAALLTTFNEIDLSLVQEVRQKHKDLFEQVHNVKLGLMSFFVKATVEALKSYPMFNSYIEGDEIVTKKTYDIGVAVGTEKGVIVPVIKDADLISFADIERQIVHFATLAKEGRIKVEDLQGAGFTITNGGVYGSLLSTPIVIPPQSGILGLHKIEKRAVVIEDQIVIRPMMYVALTYDHRIVDGKEAIGFLVKIKTELEDLSRFLLDL
jgi:2-oxoglutarate dehydrogenase E2 component (dihydrolipoamide succinyltransferase)